MKLNTTKLRPVHFKNGDKFDVRDFSGMITALTYLKMALFIFVLPITVGAALSSLSVVSQEYWMIVIIEIVIAMPVISIALSASARNRINNCMLRMGITYKELFEAYVRSRDDERMWEPKKNYIEPMITQYISYKAPRAELMQTQKLFIISIIYICYFLFAYNYQILGEILLGKSIIEVLPAIISLLIISTMYFIAPYILLKSPIEYDREKEFPSSKKYKLALILSIFLGWLGIDRLYLGYYCIGIIKLVTFGLFGVLWILDIYNIVTRTLTDKQGLPLLK